MQTQKIPQTPSVIVAKVQILPERVLPAPHFTLPSQLASLGMHGMVQSSEILLTTWKSQVRTESACVCSCMGRYAFYMVFMSFVFVCL